MIKSRSGNFIAIKNGKEQIIGWADKQAVKTSKINLSSTKVGEKKRDDGLISRSYAMGEVLKQTEEERE